MKSNEEGTFEFLTRSYVVAKFITISIVAIAGIAVSIVALDVSISKTWTDVRVPLYIVAIITVPLAIIYGIFAIIFLLLFKDSLSNTSFYKNKAGSLEKSVSYFRDLAYNDPITGIKNSRGLNRELAREGVSFQRCLMLLDLIDFGSVNNKYNHWKGDEYLRQFSEMVSCKSRRDEFIFKKRPTNRADPILSGDAGVKAFRKYSGGDEFYILIEGSIIDGLGFLNRLIKRSSEFEKMAIDSLKGEHPFGFHAGLIAVGIDESFDSIDLRSAESLQIAKDKDSPLRLYWNNKEMPEIAPNSFEEKILMESTKLFRK